MKKTLITLLALSTSAFAGSTDIGVRLGTNGGMQQLIKTSEGILLRRCVDFSTLESGVQCEKLNGTNDQLLAIDNKNDFIELGLLAAFKNKALLAPFNYEKAIEQIKKFRKQFPDDVAAATKEESLLQARKTKDRLIYELSEVYDQLDSEDVVYRKEFPANVGLMFKIKHNYVDPAEKLNMDIIRPFINKYRLSFSYGACTIVIDNDWVKTDYYLGLSRAPGEDYSKAVRLLKEDSDFASDKVISFIEKTITENSIDCSSPVIIERPIELSIGEIQAELEERERIRAQIQEAVDKNEKKNKKNRKKKNAQ